MPSDSHHNCHCDDSTKQCTGRWRRMVVLSWIHILHLRKRLNRIADEVRQTCTEHKGGKKTQTNKQNKTKKKQRQCSSWQHQLDISHFSLKVLHCHLALSLENFPELALNPQCNRPHSTQTWQASSLPESYLKWHLQIRFVASTTSLVNTPGRGLWIWNIQCVYNAHLSQSVWLLFIRRCEETLHVHIAHNTHYVGGCRTIAHNVELHTWGRLLM